MITETPARRCTSSRDAEGEGPFDAYANGPGNPPRRTVDTGPISIYAEYLP
jgi:hypothetical protein